MLADKYLKLTFDDNSELKIIFSHDLFNTEISEWESINEFNCLNYVGNKYAKLVDGEIKEVKLISVEIIEEPQIPYSAQTVKHTNVFFNDMLTFTPQRAEGIYKWAPIVDMKYDQAALKKDIKKYGLYTTEDFAQFGLSKEAFEAVDGPYFKILVGKGMLTYEDCVSLIEDFVIHKQ